MYVCEEKKNMKFDHRVLLCCVVAWICCAVVECHRDILDADGGALKARNSTDEERPENGVVKDTNIHEGLLVKPHPEVILSDRGGEDAIKIPDQVCQSDFPMCTETGGNCEVRVEEESENSAVQCDCPDKSVYENGKGCTVSDEVCKTYFPKCMDTGGKCNVDVGNENEEPVVQCECTEMSGYKEGAGCKVCNCGIRATGCNFVGDFKTCKCLPNTGEKEGRCVDCNCGENSTSCKFTKSGKKVCKCNFDSVQVGEKCIDCSCGNNSNGCKFENGEKECACHDGYGEKDGICTECDCGEFSASCEFEKGEKKCVCLRGYYHKDGVCTECKCGNVSYGCKVEDGVKICLCKGAYYSKDGVCTDCECGDESISCEFANGEKQCKCDIRYADKNGVCTACDCGDFGLSCSFQGDNKTCDCYGSRAQKGDKCVDCDCGYGSSGCRFDGDEKTCDCSTDYYQIGDQCEGCSCGYYSTGCSVVGDIKTCNCWSGYAQMGDWCAECYCGSRTGTASCHFDNFEKKCECKEGFLNKNGLCVDPADECLEICGDDEDVTCTIVGNMTLCTCDGGYIGKQFEMETKTCRTDYCYEDCGILPGNVDDEVECRGDPFGDVRCVCRDDDKKFDRDIRKCRDPTQECEEICGLDKNLTCIYHKEDDTFMCLCDEGKLFYYDIKECKKPNETQPGLSAYVIAAIAMSILVAIVLLSSAVFYHLKYSKKSQLERQVPDYRNSSVNVIYNIGSGNMEFQEGRRN